MRAITARRAGAATNLVELLYHERIKYALSLDSEMVFCILAEQGGFLPCK
jgi:hypothetical protein